MPSKIKKMTQARKAKEEGGREEKYNTTAILLLNPKLEKLSQNFASYTCPSFNLEANILHLEQKAAKSMTCM